MSGPRMTILIVEDEDAIRRITRRMLEIDGHRVLEAPDGVEAIRIVRDEAIDVVLIDLYMPNMDGIELARHLRKSSEPIPRIVAFSGALGGSYPDVREIAVLLGAVATLAKPFTHDELRQAIRTAQQAPSR